MNDAASRIELVVFGYTFFYADNIEYVNWKSNGERCNPSGLLCFFSLTREKGRGARWRLQVELSCFFFWGGGQRGRCNSSRRGR